MKRAAGLKAVGMCRDAAHGVEADRPPDHLVMPFAAEISPRLVDLKSLVKRDAGQLCRDRTDTVGGNTTALCHGFGGVVVSQIPLCHQVQNGAVRNAGVPIACGKVGADTGLIERGQLAGVFVDHQFFAIIVPHEQSGFGVDQHGSVGETG